MPSAAADLIAALHRRHAVKHFDPSRTIDDVDVAALIEVARLSASSFGLQPYRLVVVADRAKLLQLYDASMQQAQVRDCSHLFVLQARRHIDAAFVDAYMALIGEMRGVTPESLAGFRDRLMAGPGRDPAGREGMIWAQRQCYTVLGHLLLATAMLELAAGPMEGFLATRVDAVLGDEATWTTTVLLAVGYALPNQGPTQVKVRRPLEQFVRCL